jgi:hypothetical protein
MDFNTTIDIILKDLREVREIVDDLKNYPGIPKLQIELAKSKCRSAEEIIALLKTLKPEEGEKGIDVKKFVEEQPQIKPPIKQEPKLIEITDEEAEEKASDNKSPAASEKISDSAIIADRFSGSSAILLDQFGDIKKEDDIASVIKTRRLVNLSDAIGVNDKFLFVREIFSGSQPLYEEAISKLNTASSFNDAKTIIMSYPGVNEENEVVKQLLDIVKRKLPSDG